MCFSKVSLRIRNFVARKRLWFFVFPSLTISFLFVLYQLVIFWQLLQSENDVKMRSELLIRGIHENEAEFYKPDPNEMFRCIRSMELIQFSKVNDNYCDCLDATDEPGTNACPNGLFYCSKYTKNYPKKVPSTKVNDGICDCCDGSDEFAHNQVLMGHFERSLQEKMHWYHVPCPRLC